MQLFGQCTLACIGALLEQHRALTRQRRSVEMVIEEGPVQIVLTSWKQNAQHRRTVRGQQSNCQYTCVTCPTLHRLRLHRQRKLTRRKNGQLETGVVVSVVATDTAHINAVLINWIESIYLP